MIIFFGDIKYRVLAVHCTQEPGTSDKKKLQWLFGKSPEIQSETIEGRFYGPRKEMITPWSTNAVEITQNMGIGGILRIEEFFPFSGKETIDPMLQYVFEKLDQKLFTMNKKPEPIQSVEDISAYNQSHGLALSEAEINYLEGLSSRLGRKLTDSEVFGFSQVNSEHCRHKIFNGKFIIDGNEMPFSLFRLIRETSKANPNKIISAYSDNVAFVDGPAVEQFAPEQADVASFFEVREVNSVLSLKAETHNFPTTVEPFNGAATGTGGEIRDRMAGGKGSMPLGGTAVYMTSYPRTISGRPWESHTKPRKWLYQNPEQILIKASNGASDFGNKFGQPLICGSLLTFEHFSAMGDFGYDKVIMLAGGVGMAIKEDSLKGHPEKGDRIIVMGGDNYRIGMGGGSVSSVATGEYGNAVELNAVQRSNPEMQKRVANVIRALAELPDNPIVSVHDHGAGGHLNALSELIEITGGCIDISKLPVGDKSLSYKEIIGNESQERMGLLMRKKDLKLIQKIAARERAPIYVVGEATGDGKLEFKDPKTGLSPIQLDLTDMFGNPPETELQDKTIDFDHAPLKYQKNLFKQYLEDVLQMEAVACKDWLTNKVDRSVTGRVALQQTTGEIQLPLNNLGVMALDYTGTSGVATSIGHAPVSGLIDSAAGSLLSVAEALTNLVWAPIEDRLKGVSLSANWMWPAKNEGENARLYKAVEAISRFAIQLGINIPTGKDSLSMKQQYADQTVLSPGTVIVSTIGEVTDIGLIVTPELKTSPKSSLFYIAFSDPGFPLGGSSFSQLIGELGNEVPRISDPAKFVRSFNAIQELINTRHILAGHDISSGGLVTSLLEMCFPNTSGGMEITFKDFGEKDWVKILFSEKPGIVIQVDDPKKVGDFLTEQNVSWIDIGKPIDDRKLIIRTGEKAIDLAIDPLRDTWMKSSYLLDRKQSGESMAKARYKNFKAQPLKLQFPGSFSGRQPEIKEISCQPRAAIIREKGVNGDREMAWALYAAGFEVKDVHMTDLISGLETLEDVQMVVFVGGFSNSDVLGSAKGWAGAFLYNKKAAKSLTDFFRREDTLSLGVCNGCQLMVELNLLGHSKENRARMLHNDSGKFESAFLGVTVQQTNAVMFDGLENSQLGIWVAHGEGKFHFPVKAESRYNIPLKYSYEAFPGNPNGSMFHAAALCSDDGRHLAIMPHLERSLYPWQWAHYPENRKNDQISPWFLSFVNAKNWIANF